MENLEKRFELGVKISGKNAMEWMSEQLTRFDEQAVDIERGKLKVAMLKQMNNRSRLLLDAAKYELKARELAMSEAKEN